LDLLKLAEHYDEQSQHASTEIARYAADNAANHLRRAHQASQEADAYLAAQINGEDTAGAPA
jgi:hypothetical protein